MTIYFKNGFYDDTLGSVPEGAVAVGGEEYAALFAGQAQGGQIAADSDGRPVLTPPRPSEYHEWDGKKWKISKAAARFANSRFAKQKPPWHSASRKRRTNSKQPLGGLSPSGNRQLLQAGKRNPRVAGGQRRPDPDAGANRRRKGHRIGRFDWKGCRKTRPPGRCRRRDYRKAAAT